MYSLRERSSVIGQLNGSAPERQRASIHVLQIAVLTLDRADRLLGCIRRQVLNITVDVDQRLADIFCHRLGVAADVEMRATLEPIHNVASVLPDVVLNVEL